MEASKNFYNRQYESWMPWIEDKYLAWFGKNKTSYVAEEYINTWDLCMLKQNSNANDHDDHTENLNKTKITGNESIDAVQDGVNKGVTGQFEKGGLLGGVGDLTSKQVINRSERQGKDDNGKFI